MKEGLIRRHLTFEPLSGLTFGPEDLHMAGRGSRSRAPIIELHDSSGGQGVAADHSNRRRPAPSATEWRLRGSPSTLTACKACNGRLLRRRLDKLRASHAVARRRPSSSVPATVARLSRRNSSVPARHLSRGRGRRRTPPIPTFAPADRLWEYQTEVLTSMVGRDKLRMGDLADS
jgi:hypothetical protein